MRAKTFSEVRKASTFSELMKFNPYHDRLGRFASGNGGGAAGTFGGSDIKTFAKSVEKSKETIPGEISWRVTAHTESELKEWYPDAKFHVTSGGSTIAVASDGDIVSVSKCGTDKSVRGKDLLKMAVENGGTKLDSYDGNHGFYTKCGFEPVSWCKWSDEFAPPDWITANGYTKESWSKMVKSGESKNIPDSKLKSKREDIVFYKYTGKNSTETADDFKRRISASDDYDKAMETRNNSLKK